MKNLWITLGVVALLFTGQFAWFYTQQTQVVAVDVQQVFDSFTMKKELEQKLKGIESAQTQVRDSLKMQLTQMEMQFQNASEEEQHQMAPRYEQMAALGEMRSRRMQEELERAITNFDTEIWNQLNAYLSEFGKENGYDLVVGKVDHSVLSVTPSKEKTQEAIEFVNSRYAGN